MPWLSLLFLLGGCHWCADDTMALIRVFPILGLVIFQVRGWFRNKRAIWENRHARPNCVHKKKDLGKHP